MTEEELRAEHDRIYREAWAVVNPLMELHDRPRPPELTSEQEQELRRGIGLFGRVVQMNPRNWAAIWATGKAFQRLGQFEDALACFSRAHHINPGHPDVSREAAIAAMELARPGEAIPFCLRAIDANPNDPGLLANLALATLFTGDAKGAARLSSEALQRAPNDEITRRILELCREVIAGTRACPGHARDIT
jgi:tetratricopeptide (TPR) repeat protein